MAHYRILVTSRTFGTTSDVPRQILEEAGCEIVYSPIKGTHSEEQLLPLVKDVDGMIIGLDKVTAKVLAEANRLKVVSIHAVGTDHVDLESATARGVAVTNAPGGNSPAVAELAFALMMSLARNIIPADKSTKSGEWRNFVGVDVWGKTIGILGLGRIGKELALRARGFNMEVLAYDTFRDEVFAQQHGIRYVDLAEALAKADFVVVCLPLTDATRGLISREQFVRMKPTAYFVNVARGAIVDETALFEALTQGRIAGAALDAFAVEPVGDSPLFQLDNVIATPHMGAFTREAVARVSEMAARNAADVLLGRRPKFLVNTKLAI